LSLKWRRKYPNLANLGTKGKSSPMRERHMAWYIPSSPKGEKPKAPSTL